MESNLELVKQKFAQIRANGSKRVHIDIGDGLFSELLTIAPADLQEVERYDLEMDMHLLVDDPTEYIEECVALKPSRLLGQVERMGSQLRYLNTVKEYGFSGGLALKIETPIESIEKEAFKIADAIILLAVPAGTSGSKFDDRVISKITELRKFFLGSIIVDGGINQTTMTKATMVGANECCANSSYWKGLFLNG